MTTPNHLEMAALVHLWYCLLFSPSYSYLAFWEIQGVKEAATIEADTMILEAVAAGSSSQAVDSVVEVTAAGVTMMEVDSVGLTEVDLTEAVPVATGDLACALHLCLL